MNERVTSVALKRGLFALRYVRSSTSGVVPTVLVRPTLDSEAIVEVISAPGERPGVILAPGGCLVVRAEQPGTLEVTIHAAYGAGSPEAELRLEPLLAGRANLGTFATEAARPEEPRASRARSRAERPIESPRLQLELVGHVSRRGDVRVGEGQWIAGPDAPSPIEGVALRVIDTPGVSIEYQVLVGGSGASWTRWTAETYAGTQGKFRPLYGVRLRVTGPGAAGFEIEAEALFLGSATSSRKGREIELSSNAGADPLVGLKVALISSDTRASAIDKRTAEALDPESGQQRGRVRVFRASSMRS